eukprot:Opistho-2@67743
MIISHNEWGRSEPTISSNITVPDAEKPVTGAVASSSSGNTGAIVGSVIGVLIFVVASVLGGVFIWRRRHKQKREAMVKSELELIDTVVRRPEIAEIEIPGTCIRFRNKIGEGEFGEVYLSDVDFGTSKSTAAVKTFKLSAMSSVDDIRSARSAFMSEIDLMRTVPKHRNLIELLGVCTQSEPNCMVLEYAQYGDLRHFIVENAKSLDVIDFLVFCLDIARGMEQLAKCQIVHRDLAARNSMVVAPSPTVKNDEATLLK